MPFVQGNTKLSLSLRIEAPDGKTKILEIDKMEIGPRLTYYDDFNEESRDTELTIDYYQELSRGGNHILAELQPTGREFMRFGLTAQLIGDEDGIHTREIDPELYHELKTVHKCSGLKGFWVCTCGAPGVGTVRLGSNDDLDRVLKKNHKSHAKRAREKAERKRSAV